ncbi:hypothetical protein BV378_15265 [Nostoc sp. RF31YmG]|nr:hypothetical protein BV378_15265 [Nostoc sp. RF31YmG]
MNSTDAHSQPLGFKFIGLTKDRLWGIFVKDDGQNWSELKTAERQRSLDVQRTNNKKPEKLQPLSEPERDKEIDKIFAQLSLNPEHQADLQRRGLSKEHISAGMFRSVKAWQKLEFEVSPKLAGVAHDGRSLITKAGYVCPIRNPSGEIICWQLRTDDQEKGKYRWPSSATKKRPDAPTSHLPSGELPLTCCRPIIPTDKKTIGLTEGVLKPWITAQLSNQITLGASGANFAGSAQTFKAYLDELSAESGGINEVILYADAGAISNRHVMRQYRRIHDLLRKWRYKLYVGWWNQRTKGDLDIDELLASGRGNEIKVITWTEFEQQARFEQRFCDEIKIALDHLSNQLNKTFKGFGQPPQQKQLRTTQQQRTIKYVPGQLLSFDEYKALGSPKIYYAAGERLQIWIELAAKGYNLVLDSSPAGSGKSHDAGLMTPEELGCQQLFYLSEDHRNPTTATVETNYVDLPVRHNGLVADETKIRWPKQGEQPNTTGNCFRTPLFHYLAEKGWQSEVNQESSDNLICRTCHLAGPCRGRDINGQPIPPQLGATFRRDRSDVLKSSRIRAHFDSMPLPETNEQSQASIGAFIDEASRQIDPIQFTEIQIADFDRTMMDIQQLLPKIYEQIKFILLPLRSVLAGCHPTTQENYYGWEDGVLRKLIGEISFSIADIIEALELVKPNLTEVITNPDGVTKRGLQPNGRNEVSAPTIKYIRANLRQESYRAVKKEVENLPANWVQPLLRVLARCEQGSIRIVNGRLIITTYKPYPAEKINALKFAVLMDATASREYLALCLKKEAEEITHIEQETSSYENLTIQLVTGMGLLGKDRSETMRLRIKELREALTQQNPDISFIDHKSCKEASDGHWFNDNRGSNIYQERFCLTSIGTPYPDIGCLQQRYITLTSDPNIAKDAPYFAAFVQQFVQAEVIQLVGRLRANRRQKEQLTCIIVTDENIDYLANYYPGAIFAKTNAFQITPAAGTPGEQTKWAIVQAARQLLSAGEKLTQQALTKIIGRSQGRISQIASEMGGWCSLKKILVALIKALYSTANNFSSDWRAELTDDEMWLAQTYLPLVLHEAGQDSVQVVQEVLTVVQSLGWGTFKRLLNAIPRINKASLMLHLVTLVPSNIRGHIEKRLAEILQVQNWVETTD